MRLLPLPAFADNYIWTLSAGPPSADIASADMPSPGRLSTGPSGALIVDPGEAAPVLAAADAGLRPAAILLTHHHHDHIGGTGALRAHWPGLPVFAPRDVRIALPCTRVGDGDRVEVDGWRFEVLAIPGHTTSHIAFFGHGILFCGDTLFSLGCGRLFEGTPAQMLASLERLAALPAPTRVCCGHEYTLANAAFARLVDPENSALRRRTQDATAMRQSGLPSLPATLADEIAANPFLRIDAQAIRRALTTRLGRAPRDRVESFAELRRWKDGFRA